MKKLSVLSVALFFALLSNAQIVNIPDANFKAALVSNTSINTNGDDEIQVSEASAYDGTIDVQYSGIIDLTGIEAFTALTYLNCSNNQLTTLNLSNNVALTNLYCVHNQLSTLDVSNNTALTYLTCYYNQLSTLNVSNNTALTNLNCYNNQLSTLDVSNSVALTNLNCSTNQLTTLDVSNNTALTILYCIDNQLSILDISNNTALNVLKCSYNQLSTLDVSNNIALIHLRCFNNQLSTLDISNNTALSDLYCSNNQLSTLDVSNNLALTDLKCFENELSTLDVSNNTALNYLHCYSNQLSTLDLSNITALTELYCHFNQLSTLDLSNNTALTDLKCYNNQLSTLDVSNNPALTYLHCATNQLSTLNLSNSTALTDLICSTNQLSTLDVSNNTALTDLNCYTNQLSALDLSNNTALTYLNCYNNQLTSLNVQNGNNTLITNDSFNANGNPNLHCIEVDDLAWAMANWTHIEAQTTFGYDCLYGIDYPNSITGRVVIDDNCILDGTEQGLQGVIVKTEPVDYYGITNNLGEYTISTDTGTYQVVQLISDINGLFVNPLCPIPNHYTIDFDTLAQDTSGINFFNEGITCPYLTIDLSSNRRRRCFENHTYIHYCNEGYADASDVMVHVKFPEYVNLVSANHAYTIDGNDNYVFDIGALAQGECGTIHIIDSVSCEFGITGLTQCTEAWITPPNDCVEALDTTLSQWDKSSVMVEGECVNDTIIRFTITNTGDFGEGDMQSTSEYRIYADNELVHTSAFQLNGQESLVVDVPANGQTIRLEADQHPMHPGNSHPQETIEACGDGVEPISLGFVNTVPMDDADANIEIDCMTIIDSYDPNDKSVSPQGITTNNYIMPGVALDYTIRFQNTGSDTAYTVVVVDTLSNNLDLSTIQWGISSHPYTLDVTGYEQAILKFTFNDINLPDSTTNEANSHGFVKFKIAPYDTLVNGTEVDNTADIYFDYNLPIRTNTTHVIISDTVIVGDPIITNIQNDFHPNRSAIKIFPNPTKGKFSIGAECIESVEVINLQGKKIYLGKEKEIDLRNEPTGIYFIRVTTNNEIITRKLIKN